MFKNILNNFMLTSILLYKQVRKVLTPQSSSETRGHFHDFSDQN